jgi:hypothetical protein
LPLYSIQLLKLKQPLPVALQRMLHVHVALARNIRDATDNLKEDLVQYRSITPSKRRWKKLVRS